MCDRLLERGDRHGRIAVGADIVLELAAELRDRILTGQAAPSARPQIVVPGMIPMVLAIWSMMSRSSTRPPPALIRCMIM